MSNYSFCGLKSVHDGHVEVQHYEVEFGGALDYLLKSLLAVDCIDDFDPAPFKIKSHDHQLEVAVVCQQTPELCFLQFWLLRVVALF